MSIPTEAIEEEIIASSAIDHAVGLLSQQIWCWGRDIIRPEGNWLLHQGFTRLAPPEDREDCSSVYTLIFPDHSNVVVRGFGVFYGSPSRGGIFLPRYEFQPRFTPLTELGTPPWEEKDLPSLNRPTRTQRKHCLSLSLDLIDWIRSYETTILEELGIEYRRRVLQQWNNGKRHYTKPEEFASAWRELSFQFAANADAYLV